MNTLQSFDKHIEYLPAMYLTKSMRMLFEQGKKITEQQRTSLMIAGEKGTGKELLARSIHYNTSPNAPFYTINCTNIPLNHFEDRIDAFLRLSAESGCSVRDNGKAFVAGTLFLRNIAKLDREKQKQLLELIREKLTSVPVFVDDFTGVRIMFSVSTDAEPADKSGCSVSGKEPYTTFNPSLLSILPLRDRKEDIYPLAIFFVDSFAKEHGKDIGGIHSGAVKVLESYPWPHNISELKDVIENAVLLSQSPLITKEDIRFNVSKKSIALESFLTREDFFRLDEIEKIYIQTVLRRLNNNKSKTAKILGISRNTLLRKIESFSAATKKSRGKKKQQRQQQLIF
jgi:DNA-binding NtrC family response regulator